MVVSIGKIPVFNLCEYFVFLCLCDEKNLTQMALMFADTIQIDERKVTPVGGGQKKSLFVVGNSFCFWINNQYAARLRQASHKIFSLVASLQQACFQKVTRILLKRAVLSVRKNKASRT